MIHEFNVDLYNVKYVTFAVAVAVTIQYCQCANVSK